ncbi:MAG: LysM peptidoglycan-binding domain-containing protein [Anaerolineales bacterium]|nr:LysM peptidoglycan-binding domain-containing protein [Anaerolineales bacterium]
MLVFLVSLLGFSALACNLGTPYPSAETPFSNNITFVAPTATTNPYLPPTRDPNDPILTPTPDAPHTVPGIRTEEVIYTVQYQDTLGTISQNFGVPLDLIMQVNDIADPNLLSIGQTLLIPPPAPAAPAPAYKIIPDSELVNGPLSATFDVAGFIAQHAGYLNSYFAEVDGEVMSGAEIVELVATNYSVNPRLLLAVLEYQSGWVTHSNPPETTLTYPLGKDDAWRDNLYYQLTWAADNLNRGYYWWQVGALGSIATKDGRLIPTNPLVNAGTAGVQYMFGALLEESGWRRAVSEGGLYATYYNLFGYSFGYAYEPVTPPGLAQPEFRLPFEDGIPWVFTGGPHGGWDNGSAWAALDFAPASNTPGCNVSDEWVVAMADGLIVRAENGAVVQDLDGDGYEQTGWTILYMHIETRDRVRVGDYLHAGDKVGHPSCEGGYSTGTHVHLARRYNGEWIAADGALPVVMDGWVSFGGTYLYDGYLQKGDQVIEPCECRDPENMVTR